MNRAGRRLRATLIHNPTAGESQLDQETLVAGVMRAGYQVACCSSKRTQIATALSDPGDLVLVAGGDGTVAKVAIALAGRDIPLVILPLGTANNIARSLGLVGGAEHIIASLPTARRGRLDVGIARGPWGERRFVEAAGVGLFARALALLDDSEVAALAEATKEDPGFENTIRMLRHLVADYQSREWQLSLDGRDLSGRYLMVEAMNIRLIGPHLHLAPEADPGDGRFDLVLVPESQRGALAEYLVHRLEREATLPALDVHRGRRLELIWTEPEIHFDDEAWPEDAVNQAQPPRAEASANTSVQVEIGEQWVEVLVP